MMTTSASEDKAIGGGNASTSTSDSQCVALPGELATASAMPGSEEIGTGCDLLQTSPATGNSIGATRPSLQGELARLSGILHAPHSSGHHLTRSVRSKDGR